MKWHSVGPKRQATCSLPLVNFSRLNACLRQLEHEFCRLRAELKSFGHAISFRSGLSSVMARRQDCGRILMYHGIAPEGAQALAAQLRYLGRHFKVVSLKAMVDRLTNGSSPPAHEVVLTFDDGLRNNLTVRLIPFCANCDCRQRSLYARRWWNLAHGCGTTKCDAAC